MKILYIMIATAAILTSCENHKITEAEFKPIDITTKQEVGIYLLDGTDAIVEGRGTQISQCEQRKSFRFQEANQFKYAHFTFSSLPTCEGESINIELDLRDITFIDKEYTLQVAKISDTKVWLVGDKFGVVIPHFN